jgi:hypothetical protein
MCRFDELLTVDGVAEHIPRSTRSDGAYCRASSWMGTGISVQLPLQFGASSKSVAPFTGTFSIKKYGGNPTTGQNR